MPTIENRLLKVFLCHASEDKQLVRQLNIFLRKNGIDAWLDEQKLLGGQDWELEISRAIKSSDAIVVCLSKNSITKEGFIQKEIRSVLDVAEEKPEGTIFVIPARFEECVVPARLSQWHWLDLFGERGGEKLMRSLEKRANGLGFNITRAPLPDVKLQTLLNSSVKSKNDKPSLQVKPQTIQNSVAIGIETQVFGGIEFVKIPAGRFFMGNKLTLAVAKPDETPLHEVDIPYDYWIGRYCITNNQFAEFVEWTHYDFDWIADWRKKLQHPVVNISWADAHAYIKWLNNVSGQKLPMGLVFGLPKEAEWEKAARGADGRQWPWGNAFDKNKCNSREAGKKDTTSVGMYSPAGDSPFGVADMAGNVWEWTGTVHKLYPYHGNDGREDPEKSTDEKIITTGDYGNRVDLGAKIVIRGGSFNHDLGCARVAYREYRSQLTCSQIEEAVRRKLSSNASGFFFEPQGLRVVVGPPKK